MSKKRLTEAQKAQIALSSRLFVPGWELSAALRDIADGTAETHGNTYRVYLHYEDSKAVGVAVIEHLPWRDYIAVFVKKAHRRRGIGSSLVRRAKRTSKNLYGGEGVVGSDYFWDINDIATI